MRETNGKQQWTQKTIDFIEADRGAPVGFNVVHLRTTLDKKISLRISALSNDRLILCLVLSASCLTHRFKIHPLLEYTDYDKWHALLKH